MGYLTAEEHAKVSAAVAEAEMHTSGEIVTVLADRSDSYSDIALGWSAVIAFTAMLVWTFLADFMLASFDQMLGGWNHEWTPMGILGLFTGLAILKFAGTWLIQLWQPLKFAVIPGKIKSIRVHERAISHFKVGAERRTHGRTGVLIYLSLREHRAEIVADEPIAKIVSAEVWGEAMADMLVEIRQGNLADGLVAGVRDVGKVLSEHFPREDGDTNELPDRLIEV
jgi:putative membrane protein